MRTDRGTLLDVAKLEEAVAIQEASYRLLKWLASAVDHGFVPFDRAHGYLDDSAAAAEWIARHYANLPPLCRPTARDDEAVRRFANHFASYLKTSFVLHASSRRPTSSCGCWCPFCRYVREAPRLQARSVDKPAAKRAVRMKETCLAELGLAAGVRLTDRQMAEILAEERRSIDTALVAYGIELLRRCDGGGSGPAALALWREFAWRYRQRVGRHPRRGFELTATVMLEAEARLLEVVHTC
jgi:hypothetical protein